MEFVMVRFFRASVGVYDRVRAELDEFYGYPNAETGMLTSIPGSDTLPLDGTGRVYLGIAAVYCDYDAVAAMLPVLIGTGEIEEISESEFLSVLPAVPY
jgi:hypothetical protein